MGLIERSEFEQWMACADPKAPVTSGWFGLERTHAVHVQVHLSTAEVVASQQNALRTIYNVGIPSNLSAKIRSLSKAHCSTEPMSQSPFCGRVTPR
jgi:hypothetical protein